MQGVAVVTGKGGLCALPAAKGCARAEREEQAAGLQNSETMKLAVLQQPMKLTGMLVSRPLPVYKSL